MFIKENINNNYSNGSLREKFVREIKKSLVIIKQEIPQEERLRKELLEKIKRGELGIPA